MARQIQPLVEEECDRMEYDGSFMFDDYPDQMQIERLSKNIYERMDKKDWAEEELAMQQTRERDWREDFVRILLLNEMRRRRCRRRDRRCPWR